MRKSVTFAAVALTVSVATFAAAQSNDAPKSDNEGKRLICRSETPVGSRVAKRVCRTQAETEALRRESQKFGRDMQDSGNVGQRTAG